MSHLSPVKLTRFVFTVKLPEQSVNFVQLTVTLGGGVVAHLSGPWVVLQVLELEFRESFSRLEVEWLLPALFEASECDHSNGQCRPSPLQVEDTSSLFPVTLKTKKSQFLSFLNLQKPIKTFSTWRSFSSFCFWTFEFCISSSMSMFICLSPAGIEVHPCLRPAGPACLCLVVWFFEVFVLGFALLLCLQCLVTARHFGLDFLS